MTPPADSAAAPTLYLIDAMALAYRSHFIFISRPLINSRGQNTSAAYGFTNALLRLIEQHGMEHMAVVFDAVGEGGTFRDALFEDYKAHRAPMPEDLVANLPYIKRIVEALDIPVIEEPGVEADDVIGTLARRAEAEGARVVIVSPDKDFQQLLSPRVSIYRPAHRGEEFDLKTDETFRAHYGLEPERFIDMLALWGDTSDNVPGVPGIGEKTAMQLLQEYGSLEALLEAAAAGQVKGKRGERLAAHADAARLSKRLVTIKTDCEVDLDWHRFLRQATDRAALAELFAELEFTSLLRRLESNAALTRPAAEPAFDAAEPAFDAADPALAFDFGPYEAVSALDPEAVAYQIVRNRPALERLAGALGAHPALSVDTETTSVDQMMASLVGVSFAWAEGQAAYVPTPLPDGTSTADVLDVLRPVLENPDTLKVGQNVKYDLVVLGRHGVHLQGPLFDTMVAHYLLAPEAGHRLDDLARQYLSYRMVPITDLIGTGKNQRSMRDVPLDEAGPYACEDADVAFRLWPLLKAELEGNGQFAIAEDIEFPLIRVLADMEVAGVRVDVDVLREIAATLEAELARLEAQIYEAAGEAFNIGSTQQLGEILFERLGLRVVAKTSTGRPSTREHVLEELATEHPLPGLILDWRKLAKLKSTYVDSLAGLRHPETGRVHTDFNQTVTATGRLSCLPAGTLVNTERGLVGIETVRPGERVRTPFGPRRVLAWQATGVKPTMVLRLSNGTTLRCSPEHRLRSRGRWLRADALLPGDPVYMTFAPGLFGHETTLTLKRTAEYRTRKSPRLPERWTPELAEFVGYFMADGHIARSPYNGKPSKVILAFGWEEIDVMDRLAGHVEALFGKQPTRRVTRTCPVLEVAGVDIGGALEQLGAGGLSGEIRVPPSLFRAPEAVVAAFLRGYFEGDGFVHVGSGISVRSVSRMMLQDVQQLLTLFAIPSGIGDGYPDPRGYAPRHTLRVLGDRSKRTFCERVGFLSARKQRACRQVAGQDTQRSIGERLTLPVTFDLAGLQPVLYDAVRDNLGHVPNAVFQFTSRLRRHTDGVVLSRAEWVTEHVGQAADYGAASFLQEAAAAQYFEVRVKAIEEEAPALMFDIAVEEVEQYVAQGIVVHNSSNPNLQNIPIRTEVGREIRKAFVAEPGWCLLAADYVQIELRILASMSGDEALRRAFAEGQDIHTATAARVFDVAPEAVTRDMRRKAKEVNYGIPYGVSPWGLAQRLRTSVQEAGALIEQYQRSYPGVSRYLARIVEEAQANGYVETLLGRRRYVPAINSRNRTERAFAERVAVNMPIQGTQADMIKIAMVRIHRRLREEGLKSRMLLQVHDELVFEAPEAEVDALRALVEHEMVEALPLEVPIEVDVNVGANWLDAH